MDSFVPDAIDPVLGWRAWTLADHDDAVRLWSASYWCPWVPGRPVVSGCRVPKRKCPKSPGEGCRCGIYAVASPRDAVYYLRRPRPPVFGIVALWGKVIPGRWGWRAEMAYPKELFVVADQQEFAERAHELETYRVPVRVASRTEILTMGGETRRDQRWLARFRRPWTG